MRDELIEKAFADAQEQWIAANPVVKTINFAQQRFFFFAGCEFGLAAAKEIYSESQVRQEEILGHPV